MPYTPGPWFVNADDDAICIECSGPEGERDVTVAVVHSPADQRQANARLIANAPGLVDALARCADWLGSLSTCSSSDDCVAAARTLLKHVAGDDYYMPKEDADG